MTTDHMGTFGCYILVGFYIYVFSIDHLMRSEFLPWHREIVGKSWAEVDSRMQTLIIGYMRAIGGCLFAVGLAYTAILAIPFLEGQAWAAFVLAATGTVAGATALYTMLYVRRGTPAKPPIWGPIVAMLLSILGLILFFV